MLAAVGEEKGEVSDDRRDDDGEEEEIDDEIEAFREC
jgi:hypothetical protein